MWLWSRANSPWGGREDEQSYLEYVRKFDELIQSVGARPVLFMDWQLDARGLAYTPPNRPAIEEIAQLVSRSGAEINAEVAPVGLAFERVLAERPDLELYDPDRIHPNMHGTYLTTAVFYATIFDRSPVGLSYNPTDAYPSIDSVALENKKIVQEFLDKNLVTVEEAAFLQRIAWETVQDYQAQQGVTQ